MGFPPATPPEEKSSKSGGNRPGSFSGSKRRPTWSRTSQMTVPCIWYSDTISYPTRGGVHMIATLRKLGGIGALILSTILFAGTASGELLTKKSLSLEDAKKVAAGAAAEARKNKWNMDIAIVDDGGHLIYFERTDGTQLASADLAIGKARTAVGSRRPPQTLAT